MHTRLIRYKINHLVRILKILVVLNLKKVEFLFCFVEYIIDCFMHIYKNVKMAFPAPRLFSIQIIGFYIKLPNQKSIYLSSDTVYTDSVDKVLKDYKPEISVLACGTAQFDLFKQLIMDIDDILKFVKNSSGKVIANHMESINHCPLTRKKLREILIENNLTNKVLIPKDGDIMEIASR